MLGFSPNYPSTDRLCCWDEWFKQGTTALEVEFSDLLASLLYPICFQPWAQCSSCCQHWLLFSLQWIKINCHWPGVSSRSLQPPADPSWITANCISGTACSAKKGWHLGPLSPSLLISEYVWGQWWKQSQVAMWALMSNCQNTVYGAGTNSSLFSPLVNNFSLLLGNDVTQTFSLPGSGELKGQKLYMSFWAQLFH